MARDDVLQERLEEVLARYMTARKEEQFGKNHELWTVFQTLEREFRESGPVQSRDTLEVDWSVGQGNWARIPWIAFLDHRETDTTQRGTYCVFLFRQDMSGVYLTYNQGVTELNKEYGRREARERLEENARQLRARCVELADLGFSLDDQIDLRTDSSLGRDYEYSTIAYKLYEADAIPSDDQILADLEAVIKVYDEHLTKQYGANASTPVAVMEGQTGRETEPETDLDRIMRFVSQRGFIFEPWQIAAYVTALRTKPFVILAGVSGTGKSQLPQLIAEATGAKCEVIPVRPNWTDSSDVLGYQDLRGKFRPGPLLRLAHAAEQDPGTYYVCVVDEMNLARVEYYFAEILSRMEDRRTAEDGGYGSRPLLNLDLQHEDKHWANQGLSPNLAIVGTVNMDETTHSFSRKVLDRAFTLEFSDIDLTLWDLIEDAESLGPVHWVADKWFPRAIQIAELDELDDKEHGHIEEVVKALDRLNGFLVQAQLQVGYRTRDEAALFVLHAQELLNSFRTREGAQVDPLDLVLHMKVLPRIVGGSNAIRRLLLDLLGWAKRGSPFQGEQEADLLLDHWTENGCPSMLPDANYPQTAARLCLMWDRLRSEGFTSFWL